MVGASWPTTGKQVSGKAKGTGTVALRSGLYRRLLDESTPTWVRAVNYTSVLSPADRAVDMAVGSAPLSVLHTAGCDVASARGTEQLWRWQVLD